MLKQTLRALAIVLMPGLCAAQTLPSDPTAPHMVRAAGMPLRDGALAPGMLTVRLVEGAFARDFSNRVVEVEVSGGKIDSARTGADGRARFAHLPIGARVRAWATVGGERLESEAFEMPAESGVRLLLVAGSNTGATASGGSTDAAWSATAGSPSALPPNHPPLPDAPTPLRAAPAPADGSVTAIRAVLLTTTIFTFGVVLSRRPRR